MCNYMQLCVRITWLLWKSLLLWYMWNIKDYLWHICDLICKTCDIVICLVCETCNIEIGQKSTHDYILFLVHRGALAVFYSTRRVLTWHWSWSCTCSSQRGLDHVLELIVRDLWGRLSFTEGAKGPWRKFLTREVDYIFQSEGTFLVDFSARLMWWYYSMVISWCYIMILRWYFMTLCEYFTFWL